VGLLVVALRGVDGHTKFNPDPDTVLQADDTMIVIGEAGALAKLEEHYES